MGAVMKIKICNDVLHRLHSTYQIWLNFINIDITFFFVQHRCRTRYIQSNLQYHSTYRIKMAAYKRILFG